jgi:DNA-binding transcriptional LysR family regulator
MNTNTEIQLSRDCDAVQIPSGHPITLPAGMEVVVTQSLGGTYTVATPGGLARIDIKDADALGLEPGQAAAKIKVEGTTQDAVWGQLKTVFDPEIPVNVVDLGLVAYPIRDPKLELVSLREEKLVLICHPGHPFAKVKGLRLQQLEGQKFIGFEPDIPTRKAIDRELRERSISVRHVMEFDNIETVKRAVEIEAGVSIVPAGTVAQEVSKHTLAAVPFADVELTRPIGLIHKKTKVLSPAMKQFVASLLEFHP